MTKKQKKNLVRILAVLAVFLILMIAEKTGRLDALPGAIRFALYFIPYLVIGYDVIVKAAKNIAHGQVFDENFLMMIATFAAFGLGLFGEGEYSEALAVMLFYQTGEWFQGYAVGKSRNSISEMMSIAPEYANLETEGGTEETDPEDVHPGDIIVVRPGEKIPLDGVVIEGESFIDTAALTGESVPRRASADDEVISGCLNGSGTLRVRVTKEYEDSTVARILDLVENASSRKARLENFITRFAKYYTPAVTIGAVILAIAQPLLFGAPVADGIRRACIFLIVSCPCALVISVPLGFFGGIGAASKIGVLVKGSNYLEMAAGLGTVVMDKTGTLTKGEFRVSKLIPAEGHSEAELLKLAALAESYSTHPIAKSIMDAWKEKSDKEARSGQSDAAPSGSRELTDISETPGKGVCAFYNDKKLLAGSRSLLSENGIEFETCTETGTVVYVAFNGSWIGTIVISDTVKEGAAQAIRELKQSGVDRTVMLTGDRRNAAEAIGASLGIDRVIADLLPADKVERVEELIAELESEGKGKKLCFTGDGINDAPVLMRADLGIAMGSLGSDAAIEAADIVLMDDDIRKIPAVIRIARGTMRIVRQNIGFALVIKALILLLGAAGLANMWLAVFADVGVAVLCILNSMRALRIR